MVQPIKLVASANGFLLSAVLVVGMACLTAAGAQLEIPWQPVPFTLQTAPVLLSGLLLGARRGYLSQLAYLAGGAAGLPLFAGGASGLHVAIGPTGGYLLAFPLCAMLLGLMTEAGWTRSFRGAALALLAGNVIILALGWAWLAAGIGATPAWLGGVAPFIQSAVMQSILVFACLPGVWSGSFRRS